MINITDMNWNEYLILLGFDPNDAPYLPISSHWEQFPIVKAIREWERLTGKTYIHTSKNTLPE